MMRRGMMLVAAVVLVVSLAVWGASMFRVIWAAQGGQGIDLTLWGGEVSIDNMGAYAAPGLTVYGFSGWRQRWWPHPDHGFVFHEHHPNQPRWWKLTIPLWIPTAAAAAGLGWSWRLGRRRRQHLRNQRCGGCGYSRDGLPVAAPCPECGRAPLVRPAAPGAGSWHARRKGVNFSRR